MPAERRRRPIQQRRKPRFTPHLLTAAGTLLPRLTNRSSLSCQTGCCCVRSALLGFLSCSGRCVTHIFCCSRPKRNETALENGTILGVMYNNTTTILITSTSTMRKSKKGRKAARARARAARNASTSSTAAAATAAGSAGSPPPTKRATPQSKDDIMAAMREVRLAQQAAAAALAAAQASAAAANAEYQQKLAEANTAQAMYVCVYLWPCPTLVVPCW